MTISATPVRFLGIITASLLLTAQGASAGALGAQAPAGVDEVRKHMMDFRADPDGLASGAPSPRSFTLIEDFEAFAFGLPLNGQAGWTGNPATMMLGPQFGAITAVRWTTGASPNGVTAAISPALPGSVLPTDIVSVDLMIDFDDGSSHAIASADTHVGLLNTRVLFSTGGVVEVLQALPSGVGFFAPTSGWWTPGVPTTIRIEVHQNGMLRVLQNGGLIFAGSDAIFTITGVRTGMNQFLVQQYETGPGGAGFWFDNVHFEPNRCVADMNGDGVIDAADLAIMLGSWGPCP